MCGRFTIKTSLEDLLDAFPFLRAPEEGTWEPRFNVAPSQAVPVTRSTESGRIEWMRWGLVPHFAKDPSIGYRMINARSETAAEKPSYRGPFRRRRCLVWADGFYEWRPDPDGRTKTPMYLTLKDGRPFAFAGLWDSWRPPDDEALLSCTILTTDPNELVRPIHDRMPVLLTDEDAARRWLDPKATRASLESLCGAPPASEMRAWPVSKFVNDPRHESARCIEPAPRTTLFD